jgi:hypothetical protein
MQLVTNELDTSSIRYEDFRGREWLVAPVTAMRAMNLDKGYVPSHEIKKSASAWNGTPITMNHPRSETGELVSANSPDIAEKTWMGYLFNVHAANGGERLDGEAWYDIEHCKQLGGRATNVIEKLLSDEPVSVSTSYFFDRLPAGNYDDEYREKVSGNLRPDHLATLPDTKGACSIEQGCKVAATNNEERFTVTTLPDDPDEPDAGPMGEDSSEETVQSSDEQSGNTDDGIVTAIRNLAEKAGIVGSGDARGYVVFDEQTSNGEQVTVTEASFRDARWMTVIHVREDDELSEPIGSGEPQDAGEIVQSEEIELDEPLEDDATVAAMLHYVTEENEMSEAITARDGERFMNSAFVGVAPSDADVGEQSLNETDMEDTSNNMSDRVEELVEQHEFNAENLPDEETECFDRIYESFASNEESDEDTSDGDVTEDEQITMNVEDFEARLEEVKEEAKEEAKAEIARNQEEEAREELVDDIVANSDREREDLEGIETVDALEVIREEVRGQAAANFAATPGASVESSSSDTMPSLSASERIAEQEGGD